MNNHSGIFFSIRCPRGGARFVWQKRKAVGLLFLGLSLLVHLVAEANCPQCPPPIMYAITDLGPTTDTAYAINNHGDVVGQGKDQNGVSFAFHWLPVAPNAPTGTLQALPLPAGTTFSVARAINTGFVVGVRKDLNDVEHAIRWDLSTNQFVEIVPPLLCAIQSCYVRGTAHGVNSTGYVVGETTSQSGIFRTTGPFIWKDGTITFLPKVFGVPSNGSSPSPLTVATAANDLGQVVGQAFATINPDSVRAFLWDPTHGVTKLPWFGDFGNGSFSYANTITASGAVVGEASSGLFQYNNQTFNGSRAFLWRPGFAPVGQPGPGNLISLGALPGDVFSTAYSVNVFDVAVGVSTPVNFAHKAVRFASSPFTTAPVDLNTVLPPASGWTLWYAYGINDSGQIVGAGWYKGAPRAFLLTPL